MKARILLADDHSLVLDGIRRLLENQHHVIGSATDGQSLVREALRLRPEIVILDVTMPILNGIDAAREIRKTLPKTKLVFISMHANPVYLRKAIEAGGVAYVLKSGASEELLNAIQIVRSGGRYFSPSLDRSIVTEVTESPEKPSQGVLDLTGRQRQILQLIAEGRQNKEIADTLYISVRTVEFHRARLMSRLGARSVADLTRFAVQEGMIVPTKHV
ncbi:response regulator [Terriglobus albidus]|uniref:response regulator n=1 Tax=Terriglobus albidus TaxID=1592106 RepID=UPI0021E0732F|nr:response regulator transcription factor [Terriglobus albidus]